MGHAGWSVSGDAWGLLGEYHGAVLARIKNVTVLSVQYRLGLFGFLVFEEAVDEDDRVQSDALGFEDQALAMQWFHDSADYFGFSQAKVVIFRHDSGRLSACQHVRRKQSAGLFSG